jgi:hypothetical protein
VRILAVVLVLTLFVTPLAPAAVAFAAEDTGSSETVTANPSVGKILKTLSWLVQFALYILLDALDGADGGSPPQPPPPPPPDPDLSLESAVVPTHLIPEPAPTFAV